MEKPMTLEEIKKNPGKALGQIDRQAGKIKRLTARAEKAETLAETRLRRLLNP